MMKMVLEKLNDMSKEFYRYEVKSYSVSINELNILELCTDVNIQLIKFFLVRETPKGYWIINANFHDIEGSKIWVSKTSRKRYAYPTQKEAMFSLFKRLESRKRILNNQLNITTQGFKLCKKMYDEMDS